MTTVIVAARNDVVRSLDQDRPRAARRRTPTRYATASVTWIPSAARLRLSVCHAVSRVCSEIPGEMTLPRTMSVVHEGGVEVLHDVLQLFGGHRPWVQGLQGAIGGQDRGERQARDQIGAGHVPGTVRDERVGHHEPLGARS